MALPPKGDPRRPLHLAIRSTRLLGVILLLFGRCALVPFLIPLMRAGRGAGYGFMSPVLLIGIGVFYFVPGALFMVFSVFLGRRQFWAVVGALVEASLLGLVFALGLAGFVAGILANRDEYEPMMLIPGIIAAFFALAFGQLIYHLAKSFEAIKHPPFGQDVRGFEPLPVMPVMSAGPVLMGPGPFAAAPPQPPADPADGRDTTHDPAAQR